MKKKKEAIESENPTGMRLTVPSKRITPQWVTQASKDKPAREVTQHYYLDLDEASEPTSFYSGIWYQYVADLGRASTDEYENVGIVFASELLENHVKRACKHKPVVALRSIARVWERAERVCSLAAARSRMCLSRIKELTEIRPEISDEVRQLDAAAKSVESTIVLLSFTYFTRELTALPHEISVESNGNVLVRWLCPNVEVHWEVEPPELAWPGCKVRVLVLTENGIESRLIYNAYDAVDHLSEQTRDGKHGATSLQNSSARIGSRGVFASGPLLPEFKPG